MYTETEHTSIAGGRRLAYHETGLCRESPHVGEGAMAGTIAAPMRTTTSWDKPDRSDSPSGVNEYATNRTKTGSPPIERIASHIVAARVPDWVRSACANVVAARIHRKNPKRGVRCRFEPPDDGRQRWQPQEPSEEE